MRRLIMLSLSQGCLRLSFKNGQDSRIYRMRVLIKQTLVLEECIEIVTVIKVSLVQKLRMVQDCAQNIKLICS